MNIKQKLTLALAGGVGTFLLLAPVAVTVTGCKSLTTTNSTGVVTTTTVANYQSIADNLIKPGASLGSFFAIRQNPNVEPYLIEAAQVLTLVLNGTDYSSEKVQDALNRISVKELRTPEVSMMIVSVLGIYRSTLGEMVAADLNVNAVILLRAFRDGILQGVSSFVTEKSGGLAAVARRR